MGDQVSFDTLGIETIDHSGTFAPPPGPSGALQTYRSHQLQGVAETVISFSPDNAAPVGDFVSLA
jgi:hypothetical protein